jgi:hypothetical protein
MVGSVVAIFTAIELKAGGGVASEAQQDFISAVVRDGGIAGVCRNVEEAKKLCGAATQVSPSSPGKNSPRATSR